MKILADYPPPPYDNVYDMARYLHSILNDYYDGKLKLTPEEFPIVFDLRKAIEKDGIEWTEYL